MKTYRDNGAIGALLDEYERALKDLQLIINPLSKEQLMTVVDHETLDKDCCSIQTILSHVVKAGYAYIIYLRKDQGETLPFHSNQLLESIDEYQLALSQMFRYNEAFFKDYPQYKLEEYDKEKKILTTWGQVFDGDQMLEHAIVHILRHRRQIERFILKMDTKKG